MKYYPFSNSDISTLLELVSEKQFILLESARFDKNNYRSILFKEFDKIVTFTSKTNPETFFKSIETYLTKGYWVSGYFDYGLGQFLDEALISKKEPDDHLFAWFGICKKPLIIDHRKPLNKQIPHSVTCDSSGEFQIERLKTNISKKEYCDAISSIKKHLKNGDTYQVNYTFKKKFDFRGSVKQLYKKLRNSQPTSFMAIINTGDRSILSLSPELFFRTKDNQILTRPMKGTIKRGKTTKEDSINRNRLADSLKNRAENVMIVDLLRNDMGRVAKEVIVSSLFDIEKYKTVFQMTSTIKAKLNDKLGLYELFKAIFPCGSITGAPKVKTMEIINKLEKEARGIYTGSIGYFSPEGESCFNVAIRTLDIKGDKGELGIGGGIVVDSVDNCEFDEALLKSSFLTQNQAEFSLIETMLWEKEKSYWLCDLHLSRLKDSADYFDYPFNTMDLRDELKKLEEKLDKSDKYKIRILLDKYGSFSISHDKINEENFPSHNVAFSSIKVNSKDVFLYHKTTNRELYNREWKKARNKGLADYIFTNEKGEITEGCISNIFIKKGDVLYTPPVKSGLLPGVLRESLIREGKAKEKVLQKKDLLTADNIFISNSVKGLFEVFLK